MYSAKIASTERLQFCIFIFDRFRGVWREIELSYGELHINEKNNKLFYLTSVRVGECDVYINQSWNVCDIVQIECFGSGLFQEMKGNCQVTRWKTRFHVNGAPIRWD